MMDRSHERRQRLLRRSVALGIVLMGAATAIVSLFHPSTGVSLVLMLGSQAFTVGSWVLGVIDEEVDRRAKEGTYPPYVAREVDERPALRSGSSPWSGRIACRS